MRGLKLVSHCGRSPTEMETRGLRMKPCSTSRYMCARYASLGYPLLGSILSKSLCYMFMLCVVLTVQVEGQTNIVESSP
jgi:hypothetical protein